MISRIAIVNRGEAAMRLIHAVRELNAQGGAQIETVALYTDGERSAMFVREADLAYALGPAVDRPYLDLAVLERGEGVRVGLRFDAHVTPAGRVGAEALLAEPVP